MPSLATSPYEAGGHALAVVSSQKDLEVIVTDKLIWSYHIECVVAKANRKLGLLRRSCADIRTNSKRTLYLSFLRSHLGYVSEVWAPQTTETSHCLQAEQTEPTFLHQCDTVAILSSPSSPSWPGEELHLHSVSRGSSPCRIFS